MCSLNKASNRRKIMTHDDHSTVIFTGFAPCYPFFGQMNKTVLQKTEFISIIYARSFKNWKYLVMVQKKSFYSRILLKITTLRLLDTCLM